jgi:soluble lytic murein transglycosylase-like protein
MIDFGSNIQVIYFQLMQSLMERMGSQPAAPTAEAAEEINGIWENPFGEKASSFDGLIFNAAAKHGVDPRLIRAVIKQESNFQTHAVSPAGAKGLMQLMPGTADDLGVENEFDAAENINGGVLYLRQMLDRYGGNVSFALAAYNAGPGTVDKYGGIPPIQQTQGYVEQVMRLFETQQTWRA